jgi:hypothetical protein
MTTRLPERYQWSDHNTVPVLFFGAGLRELRRLDVAGTGGPKRTFQTIHSLLPFPQEKAINAVQALPRTRKALVKIDLKRQKRNQGTL